MVGGDRKGEESTVVECVCGECNHALRIASYAVVVRNWRAECTLAAGDVEGAIGGLT